MDEWDFIVEFWAIQLPCKVECKRFKSDTVSQTLWIETINWLSLTQHIYKSTVQQMAHDGIECLPHFRPILFWHHGFTFIYWQMWGMRICVFSLVSTCLALAVLPWMPFFSKSWRHCTIMNLVISLNWVTLNGSSKWSWRNLVEWTPGKVHHCFPNL